MHVRFGNMDGTRRRPTDIRFLARIALSCLACAACATAAYAQCAEKNYVQDGRPSALRDCQPIAALQQLPPDAMSPDDQQLIAARHAELVQASRFYGFDIEAPGWSYQQAVSPLLSKHLLLVFTNATPLSRASHFTVIIPALSNEKIQVIPAFSRGLRPYVPGWETKGSYAVFNRLLDSEVGQHPMATKPDWIQYAVLYLTMIGREPSVPTETDSIKANWDLSVKRGTTPVILLHKDGTATIVCTDLVETSRTTIWKLNFDKQGQIQKAERSERPFGKTKYISLSNGPGSPASSAPTPH